MKNFSEKASECFVNTVCFCFASVAYFLEEHWKQTLSVIAILAIIGSSVSFISSAENTKREKAETLGVSIEVVNTDLENLDKNKEYEVLSIDRNYHDKYSFSRISKTLLILVSDDSPQRERILLNHKTVACELIEQLQAGDKFIFDPTEPSLRVVN